MYRVTVALADRWRALVADYSWCVVVVQLAQQTFVTFQKLLKVNSAAAAAGRRTPLFFSERTESAHHPSCSAGQPFTWIVPGVLMGGEKRKSEKARWEAQIFRVLGPK